MLTSAGSCGDNYPPNFCIFYDTPRIRVHAISQNSFHSEHGEQEHHQQQQDHQHERGDGLKNETVDFFSPQNFYFAFLQALCQAFKNLVSHKVVLAEPLPSLSLHFLPLGGTFSV